jgi:prepilin signal peptidase PulO-like enzyme (type II secretory pathway)
VGWLGLRREAQLHGRGFWLRPLGVELAMGAGLVALAWWEVGRQALILPQVERLAARPLPIAAVAVSPSALWSVFLVHAMLVLLMAAASFIDIDEKIIPDEITVPGTLLGLLLATLLPLGLLPTVVARAAPPIVGSRLEFAQHIDPQAGVYVEPTTPVAPNLMPAELRGAPHWQGLAIGLGCYAVWCFALTPRIWRGRRGTWRAVQLILARVGRELARPPLLWIALAGWGAIAGVWWWGGGAWMGLLTSLVGLVGSGALIWMVRIVGTAALQREAMGFGDVTLMMMVGTYLGWQAGVIIFFVAPFAGLVVGILQAISRRDDVIPYGPFLCLGSLAVMVRWGTIWSGVQDVFQVWWLVPAVMVVCMGLLGGLLLMWRIVKARLFGSDPHE